MRSKSKRVGDLRSKSGKALLEKANRGATRGTLPNTAKERLTNQLD